MAIEVEPSLLITGFRPFQGRVVNGSQTVAEALDGKVILEHRICSEIFPVLWKGLEDQLSATLERIDPVLVLGLGEGNKEYPCFERFALNEAAGTDESGKEPHFPPAPLTELPVRKTSLSFQREWFTGLPLPFAQSENPGRFLCNRLFYQTLSRTDAPVGFVHLPVQGEQSDAGYLSTLIPLLYRLLGKNINEIISQS